MVRWAKIMRCCIRKWLHLWRKRKYWLHWVKLRLRIASTVMIQKCAMSSSAMHRCRKKKFIPASKVWHTRKFIQRMRLFYLRMHGNEDTRQLLSIIWENCLMRKWLRGVRKRGHRIQDLFCISAVIKTVEKKFRCIIWRHIRNWLNVTLLLRNSVGKSEEDFLCIM